MNLNNFKYEKVREKVLVQCVLKGKVYKIRLKNYELQRYGEELIQVASSLDSWENKTIEDLNIGDLVYVGDLK